MRTREIIGEDWPVDATEDELGFLVTAACIGVTFAGGLIAAFVLGNVGVATILALLGAIFALASAAVTMTDRQR